jgi:transposase
MALQGLYSDSRDGSPEAGVRVTFGHSKDGRKDLRQVMLGLVTTGPANLPIIAKPLSGNASDKVEFADIISDFQKQMKGPQSPLWIFDSAGYNKKWLEAQKSDGNGYFPWLTRIPESINRAQEIVRAAYSSDEWETLDNGYRAIEFSETYGGIEQLWVLYHSDQAHAREVKTLEKKLVKEKEELEKLFWHLKNKEFICKDDAQNALRDLIKRARYHDLVGFEIIEKKKHKNAGRPASGAVPEKVAYHITGVICEKTTEIETERACCGRFILGTNHIGVKALEPATPVAIIDSNRVDIVEDTAKTKVASKPIDSRAQLILSAYKELQGTESAFKMLKDKTFMMNRFFLHSEKRIEALLVIFALAIFIYNYMEYTIKASLENAKIKLRGPGGAMLNNITLRRVFEIFRSVSALRMAGGGLFIIQNLKPEQHKILNALSDRFKWKYGLAT